MKSKYIRFLKEFAIDSYLTLKYISIVVFMILFITCTILSPQYQSMMIDCLTNRNDKIEFIKLFFCFSTLFALKYVFDYIYRILYIDVNEHIASKIRKKINDKILQISPKYFQYHTSDDVISKINKELVFIKKNGVLMFLNLFSNVCIIIFIFPLMMSVNIIITLISSTSLVFYLLLYKKIIVNIQIKSKENFSHNQKIISYLNEGFNNWILAKFYNIKNYNYKHFEKINIDYESSSKSLEKTYLMNNNISVLVMFISIISVWYFGGICVLKKNLTIGDLILISNYHNLLFTPVQFIATFGNDFSTTKMAIYRIYDYLDYPDEIYKGIELKEKINNILLRDIKFCYNEKYILNRCNIKFESGKIYGILGESGSGKSTLIKLIIKLLVPNEGEILVNGISLNEINIEQYRKQIGYISTNNLFFNDSVYNNLVFDEKMDYNTVISMCENCEISHEIELKKFIDYNHKNISEGQARRLDITRALLKNPSVLIFDEAMSAIDLRKRKRIFDYIRTREQDFIVIVVSHDKEDIQLFDYYYKMDNGIFYKGGYNNEEHN